jgi:hypothetical protein
VSTITKLEQASRYVGQQIIPAHDGDQSKEGRIGWEVVDSGQAEEAMHG